jgi:hypothetical protein
MATVLGYRSASRDVDCAPPPLTWCAIALFMGLTPLFVGCATFVAWLITRREELAIFGLITIVVGCGMIAIGSVCVLVHLVLSLRMPASAERRKQLRCVALATGALLVNFPVCALLIGIVRDLSRV